MTLFLIAEILSQGEKYVDNHKKKKGEKETKASGFRQRSSQIKLRPVRAVHKWRF